MKKTKFAVMLLLFGLLFCKGEKVQADTGSETAMEGVYIENVNVSGMNEAEITEAIAQRITRVSEAQITLCAGEVSLIVNAGDLGISYTNSGVIRQALELGQKGNVLQRFETHKAVEEKGPLVLELQYSADPEKIRSVVEENSDALDYGAVNTGLTRSDDGTFQVLPGKDGATVKTEESIAAMQSFFTEWHGGNAAITLSTEVVESQGDVELLGLVKDTLGSSSTDYSSSNSNRRKNIENAVKMLNGKVLYPGEEISVCDSVTPFDAEHGYELAASYEMGSVVESYGGGICQVSTTLYLAVLRSELTVTERSNHSMIVGYVKPSMDAAIAEGSKDFKFQNNTDAPIYIMGYTDGSEVGFVIYGHETRDTENRKVSYESETVSTQESNSKIQEDSAATYGNLNTTQGHKGVEAKLWKTVTVNGVQESRDQVNSSTYNMTPNLTKVGTKGADAGVLSELQTAIASNDMTKVQAVLDKYPDGKIPVSGQSQEDNE